MPPRRLCKLRRSLNIVRGLRAAKFNRARALGSSAEAAYFLSRIVFNVRIVRNTPNA
jgi:ribosomal protein L15E